MKRSPTSLLYPPVSPVDTKELVLLKMGVRIVEDLTRSADPNSVLTEDSVAWIKNATERINEIYTEETS